MWNLSNEYKPLCMKRSNKWHWLSEICKCGKDKKMKCFTWLNVLIMFRNLQWWYKTVCLVLKGEQKWNDITSCPTHPNVPKDYQIRSRHFYALTSYSLGAHLRRRKSWLTRNTNSSTSSLKTLCLGVVVRRKAQELRTSTQVVLSYKPYAWEFVDRHDYQC